MLILTICRASRWTTNPCWMIRNLLMMRSTLSKNPREMLIFALDVSKGIEEAMTWVRRLRERVEIFKVGKESYTRYGPYIVQKIIESGKKVFLDLKFHDIPNT